MKRNTVCDAIGQVVSLTDANAASASLAQFGFSYDGNGNRIVVSDGAGALTTYTMDAKSRLTQDATSGVNAHAYTFACDGVDNRVFSSETGVVVGYSYDLSGRLQSSTDGGAYAFDANGNQTAVTGLGTNVAMSYDMADRLAQYSQAGVITTYSYDGDGLKRAENPGTGVTTLVWDGKNYLQGRS